MLALTSNADGIGQIEPIAQFMANPAGAQIVNAVGPIRQIVDPTVDVRNLGRYLAVMSVERGHRTIMLICWSRLDQFELLKRTSSNASR
jgi:hypothetical protein